MNKMTLLVGVGIGLAIGVFAGRDRLVTMRRQAIDLWERPEVKDAVRKADRFVAEKAPTLHGVGEAVVDATKKAS